MSISLQKQKEKKIFDAFSNALNLPEIVQEAGRENEYPDGILILNGQTIAVEQTDYHYRRDSGGSSIELYKSKLNEIARALSLEGYRGCVGIRLSAAALESDARKITPLLKDLIRARICNSDCIVNKCYIENIHYCEGEREDLIIKDYACDMTSFIPCRNIKPEDFVPNIIECKERKLLNCTREFSSHWLIISIPFREHLNIDTREYTPLNSMFERVFLHYDQDEFEELKIQKD